ncbi:MAG: rRNA maturation RNase YbeY [Clostridiales bacterium]|nr:rRNA maturation RNase YbeY [Clostridiales bacterium]
MEHEVYVSRDRTNLGHNESAGLVRKAVGMALRAECVNVPCIVSVMLTDDEGIHAVNKEYRGVDRATDVLSFPLNELEPGRFDPDACEKDPETGHVMLGDMMISVPRCEAQGEEFGHGYKREIMYLTVHSVLHLLGYDHVDEGEMKRRMRAREKLIMGDDV